MRESINWKHNLKGSQVPARQTLFLRKNKLQFTKAANDLAIFAAGRFESPVNSDFGKDTQAPPRDGTGLAIYSNRESKCSQETGFGIIPRARI